MALEIKLSQKLSQSLVMTPQLQQAIKLLQLGRMEYLEVIEKELLENPALEDGREEDGDDSSGDEMASGETALPGEQLSTSGDDGETAAMVEGGVEEFSETLPVNSTEPEAKGDKSDWLEYLDSYAESNSSHVSKSSNMEDENRPSLESLVTNPEGLSSHILWQLRMSDLASEDYDIAMQIVGNLDKNGYLQCSLEELSATAQRSLEDLERVLKIIQGLDPLGIAARDLRECLLIQLEHQGLLGSLAAKIVDLHLKSLEHRQFDVIAKIEDVELEQVYEAVKIIQGLEPRPGRPFVEETPVYITPDVYVKKVGDEYVISLNEAGLPKLRLNSQYREMLANGGGKELPDKEYLQECLKSAAWLIKSVHQRQQTIYRVTKSIIKYQVEFLDKGVSALKPLVLRDIAADVGMHESTVSRVTTNKYVHTPQGVFELKYFFTSGLRSDGGGEVSSEFVKERIRQLVAEEDHKKPLSDQVLVERLKSEGIDIARRTVAKYREALGILSSSRRKRLF